MSRTYIIYDGRARKNTDNASVLETCDTLKEAIENCGTFVPPSPLDFDPVVYSYDNTGNFLIDERMEYDHKKRGGSAKSS